MKKQSKLLLQTTIPYTEDDWHIGRFSMLAQHLSGLTDENGEPLYKILLRDREVDAEGSDPVLRTLDESDIDQLWLFAVDTGDGLVKEECSAILRFLGRGGGLLTVRDHNDLGSSLCGLGTIGIAHYFRSRHPDPDGSRNQRDDNITLNVDYPNYHSGSNGNFQRISASDHPLFRRGDGTLVEYFPAHPHEGGIGAPVEAGHAAVVATGTSASTNRSFNLVVAFESHTDGDGSNWGRAIAESSFHHLVDYNWNITMGCPSFLEELPGNEYEREPEKLDDIKQYVTNAAAWLNRIENSR